MPKDTGRQDGVVGADNWLKLADAASLEVAQATHGNKESALASEATRHGISPQTLRRLLAGRQFLNRLIQTEPGLAQALRTSSFAAVEVIARWSRWDKAGAAQAARKLLADKTTVRQLATAEREARRQHGLTGIKRLPSDVATHIAAAVAEAAANLMERDLTIAWTSHTYRGALQKRAEPGFFKHLREQFRAGPSSITLVLSSGSPAEKDIAVIIVTSEPKLHAFSALSQLAGLSCVGFEGLFITFDPGLSDWLDALARAFAPAPIAALSLAPDLLLGLAGDEIV
ncbi:hypothetical protein [Bosea sp. TND4EK4]|uniref:hypothetical protein n=1 Tax=Bosea sp. TND4EK4 TaxID=1907408 RepID=UPI000954A7D9|nr:hypothetical protein [Bosea sp. TND4EK4]SIR56927.1 hypothetical protein SAMN05880592_1329 [Bosea sp. TND4EK4]